MSASTKPSFVVAHYRRHHLYHTATAYLKEEYLKAFVTQVFVSNPEILRRLGQARLPIISRQALKLQAYSNSRISGLVKVYPPTRLQSLGLSLLGQKCQTGGRSWIDAVIKECEEATGCHMCCGQAREVFESLKPRGKVLVLEQTTGHRAAGRELLNEEYHQAGTAFDQSSGFTDAMISANEIELALADAIVVGSKFVCESLVAAGVNREKIIEANYGVDTAVFARSKPTSIRRNSAPIQLAFVGNDFVRKGLKYAAEAVERLPENLAVLNVFGSDAMNFNRFRTQYRNVVFHGSLPRAKLIVALQQCHAAVLPSLWEGSAYASYETMALGLPGIFTANTGAVVRDGFDGYLVPIRDSDAIMESIVRLRDEDLRIEMGIRARRSAETHSWEAFGDSFINGFHRIIGSR